MASWSLQSFRARFGSQVQNRQRESPPPRAPNPRGGRHCAAEPGEAIFDQDGLHVGTFDPDEHAASGAQPDTGEDGEHISWLVLNRTVSDALRAECVRAAVSRSSTAPTIGAGTRRHGGWSTRVPHAAPAPKGGGRAG